MIMSWNLKSILGNNSQSNNFYSSLLLSGKYLMTITIIIVAVHQLGEFIRGLLNPPFHEVKVKQILDVLGHLRKASLRLSEWDSYNHYIKGIKVQLFEGISSPSEISLIEGSDSTSKFLNLIWKGLEENQLGLITHDMTEESDVEEIQGQLFWKKSLSNSFLIKMNREGEILQALGQEPLKEGEDALDPEDMVKFA